MPKRFHLQRPDLAQEVAKALAQCQDVKAQQRLVAMRLAAGGQMTAVQIAEQLGISRRQFFNWVNALKAGGVSALLGREHGGGAPARIKGSIQAQLLAGLRQGQWQRAKEIQAWLKREHQTHLSLKGVYYWLGKLGGVLKVPRKTHAGKDAAQTSDFQRTLCTRLKNLSAAGGRRVRTWVADEHRYGLIPVVRRCWSLHGSRPVAPYQTKYEWSYLHSALEVDGDNAAEFFCLPGVSLEMSRLFLAHLSAQSPPRRTCGHLGSSGLPSQAGHHRLASQHSPPAAATLQSGTKPGRNHRRSDQGSHHQHSRNHLRSIGSSRQRGTPTFVPTRGTSVELGFIALAPESSKRYRTGE